MPHLKCPPCRIRLVVASAPDEAVGQFCDQCGGWLEPVGELSELVGLRRFDPPGSPTDTPARGSAWGSLTVKARAASMPATEPRG